MGNKDLYEIQERITKELRSTVELVSNGARFIEVKRIRALVACLEACELLRKIERGVV